MTRWRRESTPGKEFVSVKTARRALFEMSLDMGLFSRPIQQWFRSREQQELRVQGPLQREPELQLERRELGQIQELQQPGPRPEVLLPVEQMGPLGQALLQALPPKRGPGLLQPPEPLLPGFLEWVAEPVRFPAH
jgi:hypothetical protein